MQTLRQPEHGRPNTARSKQLAEAERERILETLQLVPLSAELTPTPPFQDDEDEMRDRSFFSPPYNPDDLFAFPFPYVPPLTHEAIDKRFRTSRAQSQGDIYQRLFRDLLRPEPVEDEDSNVPCGSCPCCQRMLSYVSTLRTVLDHMVSDIVMKSPAGTRVAPCVLCLQEHKEHGSHQNESDVTQEELKSQELSTPGTTEEGVRRTQNGARRKTSRGEKSKPRTAQEQRSQRKDSTSKTAKDLQGPVRGRTRSLGRESRREQDYERQATEEQHKGDDVRSEGGDARSEKHEEHSRDEGVQSRDKGDEFQEQKLLGEDEITSSQVPHSRVEHDQQLLLQPPSTYLSTKTTDDIPDPVPISSPSSAPPLRPTSFQQPLALPTGEFSKDQGQGDKTWRQARAELLIPPELSPRDISPTVIHGGQYLHESDYGDPLLQNEAYVTMATDNLSALCCLTLGNSLLLAQTTKTLVVIVTDGVSTVLRLQLQNVFDVVQGVGVMDSQGSTKLALLEQPELGVSFTKIYIWALDQFSKCIFLDSNTMVVQNCDELFERQELSAVPDIGWPDCFNSGVFVFKPSQDTFWKLIHFAEQQDSYDGGDQGLLNTFFRNWASDISRKLPFLYNLMANVSYTYKPAFKHFGTRVKIVQFFGSYKPWNVQFHPKTGQMAPGANVHPTYAQFVHFWLEIYTKRVLPFFSQEIQEHMYSREYACPHEVLQFIPSPARRMESLPTQPSFRVYSGDKSRDQPSVVETLLQLVPETIQRETVPSDDETGVKSNADGTRPSEEEQTILIVDSNALPGAEIGDFQNLASWEQGRMDYMGKAGSDNILKRLDFLTRDKI